MSRYLKNSGRTDGRMDEWTNGRTTGRKPIIIELAAAEAAAKKQNTKRSLHKKVHYIGNDEVCSYVLVYK